MITAPGRRPVENSGIGRFPAEAVGKKLSTMGLSADRLTKNDATFRDANERIYGSAREYRVTEAIPFLCECADPACTAVIRLSADEYNRIRRDPLRFFGAPRHAEPFLPLLQIVEKHPTYDVFVMVGQAAEIAEQFDRRPRA